MSVEELRVLAEEQAALRRVATLVAHGTPPEQVFATVTEEAGRLLSVEYSGLGRYEPDGAITFVAVWGRTGHHDAWPTLVIRVGRLIKVPLRPLREYLGAHDVASS
jgi:GAF domain-containing protein